MRKIFTQLGEGSLKKICEMIVFIDKIRYDHSKLCLLFLSFVSKSCWYLSSFYKQNFFGGFPLIDSISIASRGFLYKLSFVVKCLFKSDPAPSSLKQYFLSYIFPESGA